MPIQYKIDVLKELKEKGYSTYRIRKDKLLSESTVQKFRINESVSWDNIETICKLLDCQPGDIMEYIPDELTDSDNQTDKKNNPCQSAD